MQIPGGSFSTNRLYFVPNKYEKFIRVFQVTGGLVYLWLLLLGEYRKSRTHQAAQDMVSTELKSATAYCRKLEQDNADLREVLRTERAKRRAPVSRPTSPGEPF